MAPMREKPGFFSDLATDKLSMIHNPTTVHMHSILIKPYELKKLKKKKTLKAIGEYIEKKDCRGRIRRIGEGDGMW